MTRLLDIDPARMAEALGRAPLAVRHSLADHPLLSVEALAGLADALPEASVEHNVGDVPLITEAEEVTRLDAGPGDIARGIETNGCWMVLKNIEQRPPYRELLDACLDEVVPLLDDREGPTT